MKYSFWILFSLLLNKNLSSQNIVYGYIQDSATSERIIGGHISIIGEEISTITNNYGYFNLKFSKDTAIIRVSHVGYIPILYSVTKSTQMPLTLILVAEPFSIKSITVKSKKESKTVEDVQMSSVNLSSQQIKMLPRFFGETDLIKAIQLLPGVKGGSEGSTGLYVRGGGPDQNLILMDGAMVYNPSHLFGFFSIFNTDAINNVQLLKGGFPARYGGRLSSVLDITMKDGNMKKIRGEGSIGTLASKLTLEGPIIKDKVSFMVSARRTYLDFLLQPLFRASTGDPNLRQGYFFSDLNSKFNWKINNKSRLYISTYNGVDRYYDESKPYTYLFDGVVLKDERKSKTQWGNKLATIKYNRIINKKLFLNAQLNYNEYYYLIERSAYNSENDDSTFSETFNSYGFKSRIRDISAKIDGEYNNQNHYFRFGLNTIFHRFQPGQIDIKFRSTGQRTIDTSFGSGLVHSIESSAYIEDDYDISKKFKANLGLHFNLYQYKSSIFPTLQPRIAVRYLFNKTLSLKAAYSNMAQNIHLLTNNSLGLPNDLWVPATDKVKPMKSNQLALGIAKTIKQFEFTFETYYKDMKNVIEFKEGASFLSVNETWESKVARGVGKSYGFEFLAQKKSGKLTGWVGYTLSWVKRTLPEINFGKEYYYKYDSRHDISIVANYKENEKWDFGALWVFRTGNAITMPTASYLAAIPQVANLSGFYRTNEVYYYSDRNNFRFANYHRLDLSVTRHYKKKWGMIDINFSIYNAYSRINPFYYSIGTDNKGNKQVKRIGLFPILPSLSLMFKF